MTAVAPAANPWPKRRARADELAGRWDFAGEVLRLYGRLLDVQEQAFAAARAAGVGPDEIAAFTAERVAPDVVAVSVTDGPATMTAGIVACFDQAEVPALVQRWLDGATLAPFERYLARAAAGPVLEAVGTYGARGDDDDERHCPNCGGPPQLSTFAAAAEDLLTAHRYLECSRCATSWPFARMTCPACGETDAAQLVVYGELGTAQAERSAGLVKSFDRALAAPPPGVRFPHLRIDGCTTCGSYLLTVDLERDGRAVPSVDEIGAIPLDLYAKERGLRKIVPNLMGF